MQYKIVCYKEENIFLKSKIALFDFMDRYANDCRYSNNDYNLRRYFTYGFVIGSKGNFEISREKTKSKNIYTEIYFDNEIVKYVNGIFILYSEFGVKVDLDKLIQEYRQSRGLGKDRRYTRKWSDRSTQSWRKHTKSYCSVYSRNNSFTKEYRDNITAKEAGVKIRSSRAKEVESYHIWMYEDSIEYNYPERNWKSQSKKRKQWKIKK